ncbi:MAG: metallophosphoesterase [Acidimicrobiia bacterium]|nr:metallophosphoesterase [Acidimicrobiia bacterium]
MVLFKRNRHSSDAVTLFFASDLHGSEVCWRKFVAAAGFYGADILILGGDFTGKLVIPIVGSGDRFAARFLGKQHNLSESDLPAFTRRVSDSGFYPVQVDQERFAELEENPAEVEALFRDLMTERLIDWIRLARDKLEGSGVRIYTAPANDDPFFIDDVISEHGGDVLINVEDQVIEVAPGHEMISTGYTNRTPWDTPREFDEPEIESHIDQMVERIANVDTAIFNLHPPPYGTKLDVAPKLTPDLDVVTSAGATVMENVGSTAVLDTIKRHQPLLSLHGHIHEAAGQEQIGRTIAINPGSEYGEGILKGALVRVGGGRIHSYQATSG